MYLINIIYIEETLKIASSRRIKKDKIPIIKIGILNISQ